MGRWLQDLGLVTEEATMNRLYRILLVAGTLAMFVLSAGAPLGYGG